MEKFTKTGSCFSCNLKLNLFCYLTNDQLGNINTNRQEVDFKVGETIFKTGGPLTHIICIIKGKVKVYLEDNNQDKRILLSIVKPVQILGGPGFLVDDRHYITVTALEDTKACFVRIEDFKEAMRINPEFSMEFVKYLNGKIILQYEKILNLNNKQTHGKIADTLLYLTDYVYNSDTFETSFSRQDFADMSAMTKESAIRVLKEFVDDGIIACDIHNFKILNKEMLEKISKTG
jgi:CRP/FNR family transcriptional regulator